MRRASNSSPRCCSHRCATTSSRSASALSTRPCMSLQPERRRGIGPRRPGREASTTRTVYARSIWRTHEPRTRRHCGRSPHPAGCARQQHRPGRLSNLARTQSIRRRMPGHLGPHPGWSPVLEQRCWSRRHHQTGRLGAVAPLSRGYGRRSLRAEWRDDFIRHGGLPGPRRRHDPRDRAPASARVGRTRVVGQADKPVAVVTGASRGAGLGIAHALGSHGCTVYVTGRTEKAGQSPLGGTIHETAELVTSAGGTGIAVHVDHADDEQTKALFEQVAREQGRLDILVNNAAIIRDEMMGRTRFWEEPINVIDTLDVGLRSGYVATVYAAPLMLPQRHGLVVFTSAPGAAHYVFGPSYGVHKAGMDKMAADMAVDFKEFGIASVSIWMGILLTERFKNFVAIAPEKFAHMLEIAETPELTGHLIWALFNDPDRMDKSGQTWIGAELARDYDIKDDNGRRPPSYRDLYDIYPIRQFPRVLR